MTCNHRGTCKVGFNRTDCHLDNPDCKYRLQRGGKPKLLILGMARHGKDTVAEILQDRYGLSSVSSSVVAAERICRPWLAERGVTYETAEACYEDRVNHRAAWYDAISAYNRDDPARLCKDILAQCDMYVGMRARREYDACVSLFDAVVWVDASRRGLPPENPSSNDLSFDPSVMRFIDNGGTLADLTREVDNFMSGVRSTLGPALA